MCARLEDAGLPCWIAPRDVRPGHSFPGEITRAIHSSKVFILILSESANESDHVIREVDMAANSRLHIIQFRIEDVNASDDLTYYLSLPHRIDALNEPLSIHFDLLEKAVFGLLGIHGVNKGKSGVDGIHDGETGEKERTLREAEERKQQEQAAAVQAAEEERIRKESETEARRVAEAKREAEEAEKVAAAARITEEEKRAKAE